LARRGFGLAILLTGLVTVSLLVNTLALAAEEPAPWRNWQSKLDADHRLVGKIWSAKIRGYVTPSQLARAVADPRYVLIGETHDNPDHHRLQAWLIGQAAARRSPALVLEMVNGDQAGALDTYLARGDATAAGLGAAIGWKKRGWPDWSIYQPIADTALRLGLTIGAGDAAKSDIRKVGRQGLAALSDQRRAKLLLNHKLSPQLDAALLDDIREAHCDLLPVEALAPMTNVQRFRDAALADGLIAADKGDGAILIAGNGHVRSDRAVPWYLSRRKPQATIVAIMIVEAETELQSPADFITTSPDGATSADYFWITPRAERDDQCALLRKRFGKE